MPSMSSQVHSSSGSNPSQEEPIKSQSFAHSSPKKTMHPVGSGLLSVNSSHMLQSSMFKKRRDSLVSPQEAPPEMALQSQTSFGKMEAVSPVRALHFKEEDQQDGKDPTFVSQLTRVNLAKFDREYKVGLHQC